MKKKKNKWFPDDDPNCPELQKFHRTVASYHEAGHGVVALALGLEYALLQVKRRRARNHDERTCTGSAVIPSAKHGKFIRAQIAFGGLVSQVIHEKRDTTATEIQEFYECIPFVFGTDILTINQLNKSWHLRAINSVLLILNKHWHVVEHLVQELQRDDNYGLLQSNFKRLCLNPNLDSAIVENAESGKS